MNESVTAFWGAVAGAVAGVWAGCFSVIMYEKVQSQFQNWRFGKTTNNISNVGIRKKYNQ